MRAFDGPEGIVVKAIRDNDDTITDISIVRILQVAIFCPNIGKL